MKVLIDGHNAMYALRVRGRDHEGKRRALLVRVGEFVPGAVVYFDARAAPPGGLESPSEQGVRVVFCRSREADEYIIDAVRDASRPASVVVVTNDRGIASRARALGAAVKGVKEFFGKGRKPAPAPKARPARRPPSLRGMRFTPKDFGLPDEVDLDDPKID